MTNDAALVGELLQLSDRAFERGLFEAAYHTLCAAYHCGHDDAGVIGDVQRQAERHSRFIDVARPEHAISRTSAEKRGNRSVYAALLVQTRAALAVANLRHSRKASGEG